MGDSGRDARRYGRSRSVRPIAVSRPIYLPYGHLYMIAGIWHTFFIYISCGSATCSLAAKLTDTGRKGWLNSEWRAPGKSRRSETPGSRRSGGAMERMETARGETRGCGIGLRRRRFSGRLRIRETVRRRRQSPYHPLNLFFFTLNTDAGDAYPPARCASLPFFPLSVYVVEYPMRFSQGGWRFISASPGKEALGTQSPPPSR